MMILLTGSLALGQNISVLTFKASQCQYTAAIQNDLRTVKFPADWTIYIACDPSTWQAVLTKANVQLTDAALTSRENHMTIINAAIYSPFYDFSKYSQKSPAGVLRHELGHITCNSHVEAVADHYADTGTCR